MGKNLRENTNLCLEIMNSRRQAKETLVTWYKFDVNVRRMLKKITVKPLLRRLRAVCYFSDFSLQSYCTRNLSARAARNDVSPRRKNKRLLTLLSTIKLTPN